MSNIRQTLNILTEYVQEQYISDLIYDMSIEMERYEKEETERIEQRIRRAYKSVKKKNNALKRGMLLRETKIDAARRRLRR